MIPPFPQAQLLPTHDPASHHLPHSNNNNLNGNNTNSKGIAMEPLQKQRSDRTSVMFTNSSRAGPPSIDVDMVRNDSYDSGDTYGSNAV